MTSDPAGKGGKVAKRRRHGDDDRGNKSRAGRDRNPARHSTVNLMIQLVVLVRMIIDALSN